MIGLLIIIVIVYIYVVFILPISLFLYLSPYIPYWIFRSRNRMLKRDFRCSAYYNPYFLAEEKGCNDKILEFLGSQTDYRQGNTVCDSPHIVYVPKKVTKAGWYEAHFKTVRDTDVVEWNTFIGVASMMGYEVVIEKINETDLEE